MSDSLYAECWREGVRALSCQREEASLPPWGPPEARWLFAVRTTLPRSVAHNNAEVLAHIVVALLPGLHAAHFVRGPQHQRVRALLAHITVVRPAQPHEADHTRTDLPSARRLTLVALIDGDWVVWAQKLGTAGNVRSSRRPGTARINGFLGSVATRRRFIASHGEPSVASTPARKAGS